LRSDDKPQQSGRVSVGSRSRLAVSLAGLAAFPIVLLAACGNADHKVGSDTRPDPRASTEGVQSALPQPVSSVPAVGVTPLSGVDRQQRPDGLDPVNAVPPEDLVSQQGFGQRQGDN
jgi:hypothetical protein